MPRYSIGIDLGTTNSALAYTAISDKPAVSVDPIPQLVNANEVRAEPLLPSFSTFLANGISSRFDSAPLGIRRRLLSPVGLLQLRAAGRYQPSRFFREELAVLLICRSHRGHAATQSRRRNSSRVSPVEASTEYLKHLRAAWNVTHPDDPFDDQEVLVTVPASFDAVARDLTGKAAEAAGFRNLTMLEEPQAAFYAWLERHDDWRSRIQEGDLVLVADIGGGTTDFTLISVTAQAGELQLERIAVGEHLLLGGDNIDLALAHAVAGELTAKGTKLDAFQMQALWNNCRIAKEKLLDPASNAAEVQVTILGKGSSLIGGTIKAKLRRDQIESVLEGFLLRK